MEADNDNENVAAVAIRRIAQQKDKEYNARRYPLIEHVVAGIAGKKALAYGGFAMNLLLPDPEKIYPKAEYTLMDVDVYVLDEVESANALVDFLTRKGYSGVTKNKGLVEGTTKVYAEGLPIADFTSLPAEPFAQLWKGRVMVDGIACVPPEYLFHTMFRILSQPFDASFRWEKTYGRMKKLHKYYGSRSTGMPLAFQKPVNELHHNEIIEAVRGINDPQSGIKGSVAIGGAIALRYAKTGEIAPTGGWVTVYTNGSARTVAAEIVRRLRVTGIRAEAGKLAQIHGLASHVDVETIDIDPDTKSDRGIRVRVYEVDTCRSVTKLPNGLLVASAMTELMHVTSEYLFDHGSGRIVRADVDTASSMIVRLKPTTFLFAECIGEYEGLHTKRLRQVQRGAAAAKG